VSSGVREAFCHMFANVNFLSHAVEGLQGTVNSYKQYNVVEELFLSKINIQSYTDLNPELKEMKVYSRVAYASSSLSIISIVRDCSAKKRLLSTVHCCFGTPNARQHYY
jgi:hypothetical protein